MQINTTKERLANAYTDTSFSIGFHYFSLSPQLSTHFKYCLTFSELG